MGMIDLKCGDCLELIKEIPDNSIDLVVTDCPYRIIGGGNTTNKYKASNYKQPRRNF